MVACSMLVNALLARTIKVASHEFSLVGNQINHRPRPSFSRRRREVQPSVLSCHSSVWDSEKSVVVRFQSKSEGALSWYETRRYARPQEGLSSLISSASNKYQSLFLSVHIDNTTENWRVDVWSVAFWEFYVRHQGSSEDHTQQTLWPGERDVSQSVFKSISRLVIASWITNSRFFNFLGSDAVFLEIEL